MFDPEPFLPEGSLPPPTRWTATLLREALHTGRILEAVPEKCNSGHDLLFSLGAIPARMPRDECALGIREGTVRDIAILSRVGRPCCFRVTGFDGGTPLLSRRAVQQPALRRAMETLCPGDILPARITHLEPFGAFADYGSGLVSLLGIEALSVSRISHPRDRLRVGQSVFAVVRELDRAAGRITLSLRELLGTWEENAVHFHAGETVRGVVRSIEPYGVFIELRPNLSGLAEPRGDLSPGDAVSVFIKSILPQRMKIKLTVIDRLGRQITPPPLEYFQTAGHIAQWQYPPEGCTRKAVCTVFQPSEPFTLSQ